MLKGFSLTDVLIALVIIGILTAGAVVGYGSMMAKARSQEAKTQLEHLHTLQYTYFLEHAKYAETLKDLGFEQQKLTTDNGSANYLIEIAAASSAGFQAKATAVVDFDQDGQINVWQIDQDKKFLEIAED
ncbi:MAG: type II secretion system protein [Flavobacteriales bacterium]|nr:type II secretion system protein [Flavobacteriales bacterium]